MSCQHPCQHPCRRGNTYELCLKSADYSTDNIPLCDRHYRQYNAPNGKKTYDIGLRKAIIHPTPSSSTPSPSTPLPSSPLPQSGGLYRALPTPPSPTPLPSSPSSSPSPSQPPVANEPVIRPIQPQLRKPTRIIRIEKGPENIDVELNDAEMSAISDIDNTTNEVAEPEQEKEEYVSPYEEEEQIREQVNNEQNTALDRHLLGHGVGLLTGAYENFMCKNVANIKGFSSVVRDTPGFDDAILDMFDDMFPQGIFGSNDPYKKVMAIMMFASGVCYMKNAQEEAKVQPRAAEVPTQQAEAAPPLPKSAKNITISAGS